MFSSIRVKLTLWYTGVLALIIISFAAVTYSLLLNSLKKETDETLSEISRSLADSARGDQGDEGAGRSPDDNVKEALEEFRFHDYGFAVFTNDGRMIMQTGEKTLPQEGMRSADDNRYTDVSIADEPYRLTMRPFHIDQHNYKLYAFRDLEEQIDLSQRIGRIYFITVPLVLLLAGVVGYLLARKSLKPLSTMAERAATIGAVNLHERLPIANPKDELGNLALVFNALLDRLDQAFDDQRRFMADASHELRTPLAIIRGESEVALFNEARHPSEYQDSLRVVNDESKRLTKIVEDLFTLARADSGEFRAEMRGVYLDEIVADCVRSVRTLADKKHITIELYSVETFVRGDEGLLRRLFLNLLDNAVKYNVEDGSIRIDVADNTVAIANTGEKIPDDEVAQIFDRFYRIEKSRTSKGETFTGGAGLGLSISKWIIALHGGSIAYSHAEAGENIFLVTFPASNAG